MLKDISFLLPTKSDDRSCSVAIQSLQEMMVGQPYTYEIVVCSKQEVKGENIVWVQEPVSNDGAVLGFNMAYWGSNGRYVCVVIDDWKYNASFLKGITLLESDVFKDRKFKITTMNAPYNFDYSVSAMPTAGCPYPIPFPLCPALQNPRFKEPKHNYAVFGFVFAEAASIKKYLGNHLANPIFKHRYWDNWISFYMGERGEFPLVCEGTYAEQSNTSYSSYHHNDRYDFDVFNMLASRLIDDGYQEYV